MAIPTDLLQAVSAPGGGKIALVVGAGCSVEAPTGVPVSQKCSREVHRRLVADLVLQNGDCPDPDDLSLVADAVFAKCGSQKGVVDRLCEQYNFKLATPNTGYLIAAAMLCEGIITSIVTLNFDLALSTALSQLGAQVVGVIECPEHIARQRKSNLYYLHRNANEVNPELWVLRSSALKQAWTEHWQPIIANKVLATPVVVFAGLGTPVAVLIESAKLLRNALPTAIKLYQVDPASMTQSRFFQELQLDATSYIQDGWCEFMDKLSQRVLLEQVTQLGQAITLKINNDALQNENCNDLLDRLKTIGLVKLGFLRAHWLLHDKPYRAVEAEDIALIADLLLAIAMIARISGSTPVVSDDGIVEFQRDGKTLIAYFIVSGRGHRGRPTIEADLGQRLRNFRGRAIEPRGAFVGNTSDTWDTTMTPPKDVIRGEEKDNIVAGASLTLFHIQEFRSHPDRVQQVIP
jgi:hypothetical protein